VRAKGLKQPELFGSLHNYGGWQLFNRVYVSPIITDALSYRFARPPDDAVDRWAPDKQRVVFVQAKNGPASAELARMMPGLFEDPTEQHFGELVMAVMKYADGGANTIGYHKGILYTDKFLREVTKETVIAHPEILALVALNAAAYFGVTLPGASLWPPPFFSLWINDTYEAMPYDIGQQASTSMSKRLFEIYTASQWQRPDWLVRLHHSGQLMHNILRNTLGVILALTLWFLPLTRHRWLAAFIFMTAGLQIAAGAAGFGFNGRYEHMIIPYLLMIAILSTEACVTLVRRVFAAARAVQPVG
jgi:hypothetical protein